MTDRDDTIAAGRALLDFLEAHPDLPVWQISADPYLHGTDAEDRAEIDRIAAILEREPLVSPRKTRYAVSRIFGLRVDYHAVAITQAHMDYHRNFMQGYSKPGEG